VAEHRPVHETISTLEGIEFELNGGQEEVDSREELAAA
jgi:hypothetical protein